VPLAVGVCVTSIDDFTDLLHMGADKVVINTYALQTNPEIINQAALIFGSQSVIVSVEAKRRGNSWECFSDCGRIASNKPVFEWVDEVQERGAGEILLQSVDTDGRQRGFDIPLVSGVTERSKIPVVAASGAGSKEDVLKVVEEAGPSAIAISSLLHYGKANISELKKYLAENGVEVCL